MEVTFKPLQIAPENAGNRISEAIKLKIFRGSMSRTPLGATAFGRRLSEPPFVKSWIRPRYSLIRHSITPPPPYGPHENSLSALANYGQASFPTLLPVF